MHLEYVVMPAMLFVLIGAAHAQVPLVADGQARAIVVIPAEAAPVAQYAAEELVYHLERATGVELSIYPEDVAPDEPDARVYVGPCVATAAAIDVDALASRADDGEGDPLNANTGAGTLWGVYELLERDLGVVLSLIHI